MDDYYVSNPMISFDQADELSQFSPSILSPPQLEPLLSTSSGQETGNGGISFGGINPGDYHQRGKAIAVPGDRGNTADVNNPNGKKKKIIHRDIERQRRQEMNALYGSLRSELPLEYLKGKRSIADHMNEAVKYIKQLQIKINGLQQRRDELKRRQTESENPPTSDCSTSCHQEDIVTVNGHGSGIEVAINAGLEPELQGLQLGRVLEVLIGEGLSVVSCTSTKVNKRLLHYIQCEITDARSIDTNELQMKIKNLTD